MNFFVWLIFILVIMNAQAQDATKSSEGTSKAITEFSSEFGIRLNPIVEKKIGLRVKKTRSLSTDSLSRSAIIFSKEFTGIYRQRSGWYKLIPVKIVGTDNNNILIKFEELKSEDMVVSDGAALLRVGELEASAGDQ